MGKGEFETRPSYFAIDIIGINFYSSAQIRITAQK